jgi:hypothetical protein
MNLLAHGGHGHGHPGQGHPASSHDSAQPWPAPRGPGVGHHPGFGQEALGGAHSPGFGRGMAPGGRSFSGDGFGGHGRGGMGSGVVGQGRGGGGNLVAQIQRDPALAAQLAVQQRDEIDQWHEDLDGFAGGIGVPQPFGGQRRGGFGGRGGFGRGGFF